MFLTQNSSTLFCYFAKHKRLAAGVGKGVRVVLFCFFSGGGGGVKLRHIKEDKLKFFRNKQGGKIIIISKILSVKVLKINPKAIFGWYRTNI